jgi:hypothetical protein
MNPINEESVFQAVSSATDAVTTKEIALLMGVETTSESLLQIRDICYDIVNKMKMSIIGNVDSGHSLRFTIPSKANLESSGLMLSADMLLLTLFTMIVRIPIRNERQALFVSDMLLKMGCFWPEDVDSFSQKRPLDNVFCIQVSRLGELSAFTIGRDEDIYRRLDGPEINAVSFSFLDSEAIESLRYELCKLVRLEDSAKFIDYITLLRPEAIADSHIELIERMKALSREFVRVG